MERTAEPKVVKFCTQVGYINSSNRMTYYQQKCLKMGVIGSRDCFKILSLVVMQRVERVCQRQLSYLCFKLSGVCVLTTVRFVCFLISLFQGQ